MRLWVGVPLVVVMVTSLATPAVLDVYDRVQKARSSLEARSLAEEAE